MAITLKPNNFTNGTTADATQVNANFDAIFNDYNGNITDANVAASGITTYGKVSGAALSTLGSVNALAGLLPNANLATITTAGKVSGAALTLLANIPSGAGIIPTANLPSTSKVKVGSFTRDMTASSGDVSYTGVGFTPKGVAFIYCKSSANFVFLGWGFDDGTNHSCISIYAAAGTEQGGDTYSIAIYEAGDKAQNASISAFGADGFTLTWAKQGTPSSGTAEIKYIAIG